MASISANGSNGYHKFTLNVTETGTDISKNTSSVAWSFVLSSLGGGYDWEYDATVPVTYSITINGSTYTGNIMNYDGSSAVTIRSGNISVPHNADGSQSITFSFSVSSINVYYLPGSASSNGGMALTKIPRYATVSQSFNSKTETSITLNWSADAVCDYIGYQIQKSGGNWSEVRSYGATNGKSGVITLTGLEANTTYSIQIHLRREDSQLWSWYSSHTTAETYNYPHCTSSPNFTIGDALTLDFYNPLGRSITVDGYAKTDGSKIFTGNTTGTRLVGFNDEKSVGYQYASIPNSQDGQYRVVVSYGNIAMTRDAGNIYKIRGNEVPTINGFDYEEGNNSVFAITKNKKHIVQNRSELLAMFHSATPNFGAGSIVQYYVECNGKKANGSEPGSYSLGAINSERDVDLILTVVDSRGLSASKTINVAMLAHSDPTAMVTLKRLNNYEDETYLTIDGSVSSVNGQNTMTIQYRYKTLDGSYGSFETIGDNETLTKEFDKNNIYIFHIVITDAFGAKYDKEHTLGKGVFPLFIDTVKNSVGINCFPKNENSLEINGMLPPVAKTINELSSYEDIEGELKRSGFYTCGQNGTWCNLINLRHRNGDEDGKYYGLQIRNTMLTKRSKLQVRNHDSQGWGEWRWLQEEGDILYDNKGGTNSTVYLSESVANFNYIEIFYSLKTSGTDYFQSVKVSEPNGKICSLFSALPNASYVIVGMGTIHLQGDTIAFTSNNTFIGSDMNNPVTTNELHISKVVGYR